jgi:pyruvate/2-oxoglutarate dehydrogenase complex dihydrolipoamide dehydrogenase (E3) component
LLLAVGRVPNTDDLGLEKAGIDSNPFGFINVDEHLCTNVPGVWAIGDVNGRGAFTHTSYNDHEIVAANLFDDDPRKVTDRILCYGLFVDPPLGRIGMTELEVRASGRRALIGKRMMTRVGRAHQGEILREAADLADAGKLKPLIDPNRFTFAQANEAHALFESGKHVGKIVLDVEWS